MAFDGGTLSEYTEQKAKGNPMIETIFTAILSNLRNPDVQQEITGVLQTRTDSQRGNMRRATIIRIDGSRLRQNVTLCTPDSGLHQII